VTDTRTLILELSVYISLISTLLTIPFIELLRRERLRKNVRIDLAEARDETDRYTLAPGLFRSRLRLHSAIVGDRLKMGMLYSRTAVCPLGTQKRVARHCNVDAGNSGDSERPSVSMNGRTSKSL